MSNTHHRRRMDSETVISLMFLGVSTIFWVVFMAIILVGEIPQLLGF